MQLGLSEDQQAIKDVFKSFFVNESPVTLARDREPLGFDAHLWSMLCATGAPGMGVAESHGGGGAGLCELSVVAEELGRQIAPVPLIDHQVAARAISASGASLPDVFEGSAIAAFALRPAAHDEWSYVSAGAIADVVVGLNGADLVAVRSAKGEHLLNTGSLPMANRKTAGDRTVLATGTHAYEAYALALAEWKALTAAALVGVAAAALDIGLDYVTTRIQFGRPIGSFQAVQQGLADLPIAIDGGRLLAHKAAWAGDREAAGAGGQIDLVNNDTTDFQALASMALVFCGDAAAHATDRSLHYHGGYGYAEEYDIQLFYRRARAWALLLDDPSRECLRLADRLFGKGA